MAKLENIVYKMKEARDRFSTNAERMEKLGLPQYLIEKSVIIRFSMDELSFLIDFLDEQ